MTGRLVLLEDIDLRRARSELYTEKKSSTNSDTDTDHR